MARRVKIKRKQSVVRVKDFAVPGEPMAYWGPVGALALLCIILALIAWKILPERPQILLVFVLWPVLALLYASRNAEGGLRARIKRQGLRTKVSGGPHASLQAAVAKAAAMLGARAPDLYVMPDEGSRVSTVGGKRPAVVLTQPLVEALTADELEALLCREVLHIRAKHVRFLNLLQLFRAAGLVPKLVAAPIYLMTRMMGPWEHLVESTADRAALLLTGRSAPLNRALVKFAAEQDEMAQVDPGELDAFLSSGTDLTTDSTMMEQHYRIGTFVSSKPGLSDRIKDIGQFPKSEQGRDAFEKAAAVRQELQGA